MKKLLKLLQTHWLIIFILVLALFVRTYRLSATMTFLEDEGRDLLVVKYMLDQHRPVLIGPQTSTGNMYLGPIYYWLIVLPLVLAQMNPIGPALFIAFTGVLTVWFIYLLARKWFGRTPALWVSLSYALMPMVVLFTRNSWNPNLVPLTVILIVYLLDKLVLVSASSKPSLFTWLKLGVLFGILAQLHYMALIFIGFVGLLLLFHYRYCWRYLIKALVILALGFILIMSPFILFEFRNNFVNSRALQKLLLATDDHTLRYALPFWLYRTKVVKTSVMLFGDLFTRHFFTPDSWRSLVTLTFISLNLINLLINRHKPKILLLNYLLFIPILGLGIYQENIHPHYLSFLYPITPLVLAGVLATPKLSKLGYLFLIVTLIRFTPTTWSYISSGPTFQADKARLIANYLVEQTQSKPYNLISSQSTNTTPYQYFAYISSNPPSTKAQTNVFLVCQDQACTDQDIYNPQMFVRGPAHPSLNQYLGHPQASYVVENIKLISNQHVAMGVWIAHLKLIANK